tara:strand:- start:379 stop:567 length:189 start_codon:yes stop_codon:yes gene_type:complete
VEVDKVVYGYRRKRYRPIKNIYRSPASEEHEKLRKHNRFQFIGLYVFLAIVLLALIFAVFSL